MSFVDHESSCQRQEDQYWIYSSGPAAELFDVMYVRHSLPGTYVRHENLTSPMAKPCMAPEADQGA